LKAFLFDEAKNYEKLEVIFVPGVDPEITFFDVEDKEVLREKIAQHDSETMHKMLTSKGIKKKLVEGPL